MITTATSRITPDFRGNRLLQALAACYALIWTASAISPRYPFDWFLENILVFVSVGLAIATYRKFPFSDLSYLLFTVFLSLHSLGAHFTYSEVPLGFWLQEAFDLSRNHYDRVVHLAFGLLMAYPLRELIMRACGVRGLSSFLLAFAASLAFSAGYEISEWIVAEIVSPEAAYAYLGTQGDLFDAQKDAAFAATGTMLSLALTAVLERRRGSGLVPPRSKTL